MRRQDLRIVGSGKMVSKSRSDLSREAYKGKDPNWNSSTFAKRKPKSSLGFLLTNSSLSAVRLRMGCRCWRQPWLFAECAFPRVLMG